jgi:hypothetical protein
LLIFLGTKIALVVGLTYNFAVLPREVNVVLIGLSVFQQ